MLRVLCAYLMRPSWGVMGGRGRIVWALLVFLRDNGAKGGGGRAGRVSQGIAGVACGSFVGGVG